MTCSTRLADQLDVHWRTALRPRLEGLTDAEYFWEPVPGCWTVACVRDLYVHTQLIPESRRSGPPPKEE